MTKIEDLLNGYKSFYNQYFMEDESLYIKLVSEGQSPKTLVIACSDSRVDPSILTNAKPGDIFVVRNVANLVPPYQPKGDSLHGTSAALEFAVNFLKVENIIILGHSGCGGIQALIQYDQLEALEESKEFSFITNWVKIAEEAKNRVTCQPNLSIHEQISMCEQESIKTSLENLMTFPWISKRVKEGSLQLYGWYFILETGKLIQISL